MDKNDTVTIHIANSQYELFGFLHDSDGRGAVYIAPLKGMVKETEGINAVGQRLTPVDLSPGDSYGISISTDSLFEYIYIRTLPNNGCPGKAYCYKKTSNVWVLLDVSEHRYSARDLTRDSPIPIVQFGERKDSIVVYASVTSLTFNN